jgi:hypothetical protein
MCKIINTIKGWWKYIQMSETDRWLSNSADLGELERKLKFLSNQSTDPFSKLL